LIKPFSEDIETNTRIEQSYLRAHVVSDTVVIHGAAGNVYAVQLAGRGCANHRDRSRG
jgi:hypothetical protein